MDNQKFKALVAEEKDGKIIRSVKTRKFSDLPPGDLLIKVAYSSLNYKDALSAAGNRGITKNYPHTPGVDAVGEVKESLTPHYGPGDKVIVTGYDLGMGTDGGFGEYIRVPADWAFKLPLDLPMKRSMVIGTAGLTAGAMVQKIVDSVEPDAGKIIVTGSTGGVGSISVALLAHLGYSVHAVTGKEKQHELLKKLGAEEVIDYKELSKPTQKPMLSGKWAGAVDTVGGPMLENLIKSVKPFGLITCCGNIVTHELKTNVFPFILRGITLSGVSAQNMPVKDRLFLWKQFSNKWNLDIFDELSHEITLDQLDKNIEEILQGKLQGRTILKHKQ